MYLCTYNYIAGASIWACWVKLLQMTPASHILVCLTSSCSTSHPAPVNVLGEVTEYCSSAWAPVPTLENQMKLQSSDF